MMETGMAMTGNLGTCNERGHLTISAGNNPAPIALFVYNRPWHSQQTIAALQKNERAQESDLYIFSDAAKSREMVSAVREVRDLIGKASGFRSIKITEREVNLGLANSIIDGVTRVCGEHGRVIVLEDDLVTAPWFLRYMNDALDIYAHDERVGSVHGYWYPVDQSLPETFFLRGASCWGWATWSRAWRLFEPDGRKSLTELRRLDLARTFDLDGAIDYARMLQDQIAGKNDSWAIRWHASMFLAGYLQLSPSASLVRNIGFDGSGTHCATSDDYGVKLAATPIGVHRIPIRECDAARAALIHYYHSTRRSFGARAFGRLRLIVGLASRSRRREGNHL
jgi:hypothetical protein